MKKAALNSLIRGRIVYRDANGQENGRESFEIAKHCGGATLRALCEMDDIQLLRDVSMALDLQWQPLDGFYRITKNGTVLASSWFNFDFNSVEVEGQAETAGRFSQKFASAVDYLGLHPLQGDALITTQADMTKVGEFKPVKGITNSVSENGDQGLIATPVMIDVAWLGNETLSVAAGEFKARKFALRWHPDWAPAHVWVRDEDCVFLKMVWDEVPNWYELSELTESVF